MDLVLLCVLVYSLNARLLKVHCPGGVLGEKLLWWKQKGHRLNNLQCGPVVTSQIGCSLLFPHCLSPSKIKVLEL